MADIPDDPTWPELQAGLEAAAATFKGAQATKRAAGAAIRAAKGELEAAHRLQESARLELEQWEAALRRKLLRG